jgi:hypothetical protein
MLRDFAGTLPRKGHLTCKNNPLDAAFPQVGRGRAGLNHDHDQEGTMKVLTATRRTQGDHPGDFCWTVDGELVRLAALCDRDGRVPDGDGPCGCGRSFAGLSSDKATTTAEVAERDLTREDLAAALDDSMHRDGWTGQEDDYADVLQGLTDELLDIADSYPVGAVLGHRLGEVHWR